MIPISFSCKYVGNILFHMDLQDFATACLVCWYGERDREARAADHGILSPERGKRDRRPVSTWSETGNAAETRGVVVAAAPGDPPTARTRICLA